MSNNTDSSNVSDLTSDINEENRAEPYNALMSKLKSLAEQHPDVLESLSSNVRKRVEFLREIQGEHDDLESKFLEERAALEDKYQKLYQPLFTKRYEIVNGVTEVEGAADTEDDKVEKGVPGFWLNAMKNNDVLAEEISERDEYALKFLKDINTEIKWHPGKSLTEKVLKKKPKKGSKNAKPIIKTEKCESFFNFFNPPEVPEDDEDMDEDMKGGRARRGDGQQVPEPVECKQQ
ncbi:unnamed protein product [Lupinus luteus]|uniref:Nucleosome assembly protein n=1 Tax=Lupinus luteus TaxID=3873 RepID=A0AAV1YAG2_LUPLU